MVRNCNIPCSADASNDRFALHFLKRFAPENLPPLTTARSTRLTGHETSDRRQQNSFDS